MNLLIIDDDPVHHKLVELVLRQSRPAIQFRAFLDAADGFCYILSHNNFHSLPDLILLDLEMPLVSGWGFLELFETISQGLEKPIDIIILSSSVTPEIKEQAAGYNCVKGVFSKPLTERMYNDILNSSFLSINKSSKY